MLVQSLPFRVRSGLVSSRRVAAAAAIVALVPGGVLGAARLLERPAPRAPDAVLVAVHGRENAGLRLHEVPISSAEWPDRTDLRVDLDAGPADHIGFTTARRLTRSPTRATWLTSRVMSDSGVIDLFELGPGNAERRLTWTVGDDDAPAFSPDGRHVVFTTARWNELSHNDVARLDRETLQVTRLTDTDDSDIDPLWSPDGSRIAFSRRHWDGQPEEVCVTHADGSAPRCHSFPQAGSLTARAWRDQRRLLVSWNDPTMTLASIDVDTWQIELVIPSGAVQVAPSPDGRWVACKCPRTKYSTPSWLVFPIDQPADSRPLRLTGSDSTAVRLTWLPAPSRTFIDTLRIELGAGLPLAGVPYQLRPVGVDPKGAIVTIGTLDWLSSDTTVASIDSTGVLFPKRAGSVTITANAGGWRKASRTITVNKASDRVVIDERWDTTIEPRWIPYGKPRPQLVDDGRRGRAFNNGGDGSFLSGAYSAATFPTANGLGIDVDLSTPLTRQQWQSQAVALLSSADSTRLAHWDHASGELPLDASQSCEFGFPAGSEGRRSGGEVNLWSGKLMTVPSPAVIADGSWYHVRIQYFPDGRCGFAVNGRPIWISAPSPWTGPARVNLAGSTRWITMRVGPLQVFTGVKSDIDWASFERSRAERATR
jgi:hypothetical protein